MEKPDLKYLDYVFSHSWEYLPSYLKEIGEQLITYIHSIDAKLADAKQTLLYYKGMKAVCTHDDSSWCDHCPDAGRNARKCLERISK